VLETTEAGVVGFSYTRPEALAEGVWNLLAIGFRNEFQAKGLGTSLIEEVERSLSQQRILLVETSGLDDFKATRTFYENREYTREAVIRDYWAEGDDKIVFWRSL
jgi:ribosomal protein S18 acetylase RimI-like enzyme